MTDNKYRYKVMEAAEQVASVIAPALTERLRQTYGADWLAVVNEQRRQGGYEPGESLHDERFCLAVFAYNKATIGWAPDRERRMAMQLRQLANKAAHNDLLTARDCDQALKIAAEFRANYHTTPGEASDTATRTHAPPPPVTPWSSARPPKPPYQRGRSKMGLAITGAILLGVLALAVLSALDQIRGTTTTTTGPVLPSTTVGSVPEETIEPPMSPPIVTSVPEETIEPPMSPPIVTSVPEETIEPPMSPPTVTSVPEETIEPPL